jgi:SagB-type dehydrogenase family enzyme
MATVVLAAAVTRSAAQEPGRRITILPQPVTDGSVSLEQALLRRRSIREFTKDELTLAQISQLLWAAQGITDASGFRTAPSAGALYPLELYVATRAGLEHYEPQGHRLARVSDTDGRPALGRAARQGTVSDAPAVFVITGVASRTAARYGPTRATRYVNLEAGHAAQNLLLQAVTLGLGAVVVGAFDDGDVLRVLGAEGQVPLYLIPVGRPRR